VSCFFENFGLFVQVVRLCLSWVEALGLFGLKMIIFDLQWGHIPNQIIKQFKAIACGVTTVHMWQLHVCHRVVVVSCGHHIGIILSSYLLVPFDNE